MDSTVDIINIHMCDNVMVLWKNTYEMHAEVFRGDVSCL